ncbi:MAG: hypothetical protein L0219_14325 [Phycisphaerales bacterium]|nr:hypothetical protein [Phycisphaerales bacterium]
MWVWIGSGVVGATAVIVGAVFAITALSSTVSEGVKQHAAMSEIREHAQEVRQQARVQLDSNGFGPNAGLMSQYLNKLERSAQKLSGDQATALKAGISVLREIEAPAHAYEKSTQAFVTAGHLEPATLNSPKAIEDRIALAKKAQADGLAVGKLVMALPARFESELKGQNLSSPVIQRELAQLRKGGLDVLIEIWREDQKLFQSMISALGVMKDYWGYWKFDAAAQGIWFESEPAMQLYSRYMDDVRAAAERQEAAQRRLLMSPD